MSDSDHGILDYRVKRVNTRAIDQAARWGLASVISDPAAVMPAKGAVGPVAASMSQLFQDWRNRVQALHRAGWDRFNDSNQFWFYAKNCPPVSVQTQYGYKRTCGHQLICPWCWCRAHIHDTYYRLVYAYYGTLGKPVAPHPITGQSCRIQPKPYELVELMSTVDFDLNVPLQTIFDRIEDRRRDHLDNINPRGAFQLFTISPHDPREPKPFRRLTQRIVAVVLPGLGDKVSFELTRAEKLPVRGILGRSRTGRVHKTPAHSTFKSALGRMCRYPRQMLYGSIDDTREILETAHLYTPPIKKDKDGNKIILPPKLFRMAATYGLLRNKTERENAALTL